MNSSPLTEEKETDRTIIDEMAKRNYEVSASTLFSFGSLSSDAEHEPSHEITRMLFNITLAQKSILSKCREDIVKSERAYRKRKDISFGRWFADFIRPGRKSGGGKSEEPEEIGAIRETVLYLVTNGWFNVISSNRVIQEIFEGLRKEMRVDHLYEEVKDRCTDLDEFLEKKEAGIQSRVFNILTFILTPLNLVIGFTAGYQFSDFGRPVPFLPFENQSGWPIFFFYLLVFSIAIGVIWIIYKWLSFRR